MSISQLKERSNNQCELCQSTEELGGFVVSPRKIVALDSAICVCKNCHEQLDEKKDLDENHWRCLNDSMWSEEPTVKVVAYRMLHKMKHMGWPQDLLDMIYLDEETLQWAQEGIEESNEGGLIHKDSNGIQLENGDSVVLIKNLNVKGANFIAKRGTAVRNIRLVADNVEHIEGKINQQQIVILTQYVKKT